MINNIDNASVYTDFQGLDKLKRLSRDTPDKAIESVARQFEALFTQILLKSMRNTSLGDGLFDNDQSKMYQDLFDKQIATNLSQKKGIGLAEMLIKQLSQDKSLTKTDIPDVGLNKMPEKKSFPENIPAASSAPNHIRPIFKTPEEYLKKMYPLAKEVEEDYGVPATVMLAQSALETGWGKHIIDMYDGTSSHNLFGIKADMRWYGDTVRSKTLEYTNGIAVQKNEKFRSYDNFRDSMIDYAMFLKSSTRYTNVLANADNPAAFSVALQQAGYATDPEYSSKINKIIESPVFSSVMQSFKKGDTESLT